jgi:hypothetical protein
MARTVTEQIGGCLIVLAGSAVLAAAVLVAVVIAIAVFFSAMG